MKNFNLVALIASLFLAMPAMAGVQAFNSSNVNLGVFSKVKCSTGLTCSKVAGKLNIVSSPSLTATLTLQSGEIITNSTDDKISFQSDDNDTTLEALGFEAKDALLLLSADQSDDSGDDWQLKAAASGNAFTISNDVSGSQVAKMTLSTAGAMTLVGSVTGDGGDALSGFLQARVAATATTITAVQCGSTFYNSGAVQMELPEASTVLGCRLTFVVANAANFDVNPDNADQILGLTDAAGDAIRNATLGGTVTIEAMSASEWVVVGSYGTWSDIN